MNQSFSAWTCDEAKAPLVKKTHVYTEPLGSHEVLVQVHHCGVCFSDVGLLKGHYGPIAKFPMVAGHEGAGVVVEVGAAVKAHKVGDRVGLGVYRGSCDNCLYCEQGKNNLCAAKEMAFMRGPLGSFAEMVRIPEKFAVAIPEAIPLREAASLMCAGITSFAPYMNYGIQATDRVAIVGMGGLGHLSVQFGAALGCEVTVLSSSGSKRDESLAFGAAHFVDMSESNALAPLAGRFQYVMCTASGSRLDWKAIVRCLAPLGTLVIMTGSMDDLPISPGDLLLQQKSIAGSASGSLAHIRQMMALCAAKGIRPKVEAMSFERVNEAIEKVIQGTPRYRLILSHPVAE